MAITTMRNVHIYWPSPTPPKLQTVIQLLKDVRKLEVSVHVQGSQAAVRGGETLLKQLRSLSTMLRDSGYPVESGAILDVCEMATTSTDFGGLGLVEDVENISEQDVAELIFLVAAQLEAANSAERAKAPLQSLSTRPVGRRGMTLGEKILAAHDVERKGEVKPGDVIRVDVDWVMASELSWRVCS